MGADQAESWLAEAGHARDRKARALLYFGAAAVLEQEGSLTEAFRLYQEALKTDAELKPALFAAARLAEDSEDATALTKLAAHELRTATSATQEASALLTQASLVEPRSPDQARSILLRAHRRHPTHTGVRRVLERMLRRTGGAELTRFLAQQMEHAANPVERQLIALEWAERRAGEGHVDDALGTVEEAATFPAERRRLLLRGAHLSFKHGRDPTPFYDRLANHASAFVTGTSTTEPEVGVFPPYPSETSARKQASLFFWLSAASRTAHEGDANAALSQLDRAIEMMPDDALLRFERLEAFESQLEPERFEAEIRGLLRMLGDDEQSVVLHLRMAESAAREGNAGAERTALERALTIQPRSPVAAAKLATLLMTQGRTAILIRSLRQRAEQLSQAPRPPTQAISEMYWEAAELAANHGKDLREAHRLYTRAAGLSERPLDLLRELHGAALRRFPREAKSTRENLLAASLDGVERAGLLFEAYREIRDEAQAEDFLRDLLNGEAPFWVANVARLRALESGNIDTLITAHNALASIAPNEASESAHRTAVARACFRGGRIDECDRTLMDVLESDPANRYAVTLREEILRSAGRGGDAAELLIQASAHERDTRVIETLLLRASFLAKRADHADLAREALHQAIARARSVAAAWELKHHGVRSKDRNLVVEALVRLSRTRNSDMADAARLQLAEHHIVELDFEPARQLLGDLLDRPSTGPTAAAWLALLPGDERQGRALNLLASRTDEDVGLRRAEATHRLTSTLHPQMTGRGAYSDTASVNFAALAHVYRDETTTPQQRRDALANLARATTDRRIAAGLFFLAAWIDVLHCDGELLEALFDELSSVDPNGAHTAFVAREIWTDASLPRGPLRSTRPRATQSETDDDGTRLAKELLITGRPEEALVVLKRGASRRPNDAALWLTVREAARAAHQPEAKVAACEALLRNTTQPNLRAALLEEAGIALFNELDLPKRAEPYLIEALEADPLRDRAYSVLRQILERRGDAEALLLVLSKRTQAVTDTQSLGTILFEEAQLNHRLGRHDLALSSLQRLQVIDPGNGSAAALRAHIFATTQRFPEAVDALREVACVDLPLSARQSARWAAARYLADQLDDPAGGLQELEIVDRMGSSGPELHEHVAQLAERSGRYPEAVAALERAASISIGVERGRFERRAALLLASQLGATEPAIESYRRALAASPTDVVAADGLASLLARPDRRRLAQTFTLRVWDELQGGPGDPTHIRKLLVASRWTGDLDLEFLALEALVYVDDATEKERSRWTVLRTSLPTAPSGRLTQESFEQLISRLSSNPLVRRAQQASDTEWPKPPRVKGWRSRDQSKANAVAMWVDVLGGRVDSLVRLPKSKQIRAMSTTTHQWGIGEQVDFPLSSVARAKIAVSVALSHLKLSALSGRSASEIRRTVSDLFGAQGIQDTSNARHAADLEAELAAIELVASSSLEGGGVGTEGPSQPSPANLLFWLSPLHRQLRAELGIDVPTDRFPVAHDPVPVERHSVFFVNAAIPREWSTDTGDVLREVLDATAHAKSSVGSGASASPATLKAKLEDLDAFLLEATPENKVQLALAAAEVAEALRDPVLVESYHRIARLAVPDDRAALRADRFAKARVGAWTEVVGILTQEASLCESDEERALVLTVAALILWETSTDHQASVQLAQRALRLAPEPGAAAVFAVTACLTTSELHGLGLSGLADQIDDAALGSALLVHLAHTAEREGNGKRAHELRQQALSLDPTAFDAAFALVARAITEQQWSEAIDIILWLAQRTSDSASSEAFRRVAARLAHLAAEHPERACELLDDIEHPLASGVAIDAAEATGQPDRVAKALTRHARLAHRSESAFALVSLARTGSNGEDAKRLLREASQADPNAPLARVALTELARERGTSREYAQASRAEGSGSLAAAARCTAMKEDELERRYLLDSAHTRANPAAVLLATDCANDPDTRTDLVLQEVEGSPDPSRVEPLIAAADIELRRNHQRGAARALQEALRRSPHHPIAARALMSMSSAPARKGARWMDEARGLTGSQAAFAGCQAARWFGPNTDRGAAALELALEAEAGYPPALWLMEARARATGEHEQAVALLRRRAESSQRPEDAAAFYVRAALTADEPDVALLGTAQALVPEDVGLIDLITRREQLPPLRMAELIDAQRVGSSTAWDRVLRVRQSLYLEMGGEPGRAARVLRERLRPDAPDALEEWLLDRFERSAGEIDATISRYERAETPADHDATQAARLARAAELAAETGRDEAAVRIYHRVLARFPGHLATVRELSRVLERQGNMAGLAEVAEQFATLAPAADAIGHARFAQYVRRVHGLPLAPNARALVTLFDYSESDPWLVREVESIARQSRDEKMLVRALAELADHLDGNARTAVQVVAAQEIALTRGPSPAAQYLARSSREETTHPLFNEVLAELFSKAARHEAAAQQFETAAHLARSPKRRARLALLAADSLEAAGRRERAAGLLLLSLEHAPENTDIIEKISPADLDVEQCERLAKALSRPSRSRGGDTHGGRRLARLAELEVHLGRSEAAQRTLTQLTRISPTPEHVSRLADLCEANGDWRTAASTLEKLAAMAPPSDRHLLLMRAGNLWEHAGDLRRAESSVRQALAAGPGDGSGAHRLAHLERMLGKRR